MQDRITDKMVPTYRDYIRAAQTSKEAAEEYMRGFNKEEFEEYLYEGAWFDCNVNIMTRYMNELTDKELVQLNEYMMVYVERKYWHTSDSAIIYNYITNSKNESVLITPLVGKLAHAKDRFSFMLLIREPELGYDFFSGLMRLILQDISDIEMSNLLRYIREFSAFNSNREANIIVNRLKRDFNEL